MLEEARLFFRRHLGSLDLAIDSLFHARQLVSVHTNALPVAHPGKRGPGTQLPKCRPISIAPPLSCRSSRADHQPMAAALRSRPGGARGTKEGKRARSVRIPPDRRESFSVEGHTVRAAVIKDSACVNGKLHEMAWGYHAQADNGTVYYLGEDVNIHRKGKVVGHSGAFRYGRDTTTFGIAMPAHPTGARRSTFERIPGQGSERNRVTDARPRFVTPAWTFNRALEIKGYVLPEREKEIKYYARGVGLIGELSATSNVNCTASAERLSLAGGGATTKSRIRPQPPPAPR
jgi:hypothetical protein